MSLEPSLSSKMIIDEFNERGLPVEVEYVNGLNTLLSIRVNNKKKYIKGTVHPGTTANGFIFAEDKVLFYDIAGRTWSTPKTLELSKGHDQTQATDFVAKNEPVVVKPGDGAHGNGVTMDVSTVEEFISAVEFAKNFSDKVIVQQQIVGSDHRILVIGGKFCCASRREPASVIGDGVNSVRELISIENKQPNRGVNYSRQLEKIDIEKVGTVLSISELSAVPAKGKVCAVLKISNIGQGGKAYDVTDTVAKEYIDIAEEIANEFEVYCCGVDIITPDISKFNGENDYAAVEINASPSFGLHAMPFEGKSRDPTAVFVDSVLKYFELGA